jgi:hypothetical protein
MSGFLRAASSAAVLFLLASMPVWAQATAQLDGRVTDESGAVLPGVTVTATQTDTTFTRTVVTDATGNYVMTNLPTGPYRLEISLQGFRTYVQTGIVLQVGASPTINAALGVGNLEQTVSVEAAAPLVDVRSAGISEVVDRERIVELPLQGRQVTDLIVLAGAAVETGRPNNRSFQGGVNISVAGGLQFGVAYQLDGAVHNDPQNSGGLPLPFPDALQEFRVATSGLSAQSGMHSGASVNAVTKSGTNRYSGNVFEFVRDKRFNAKSPFAPIVNGKRLDDGLKRNQYGGTFGGPIVRDRLFFFGAYQGTRTRVSPPDQLAHVPTAAMLAGDFTAFASPACNAGRQVNLGAGFVGQPGRSIALQPGGVEPRQAAADDDGSVRGDAVQPAGRSRRGPVRRPRRLSVERRSDDLRPLHGDARQEAVGAGQDGQRADDGQPAHRQPGAVVHVGDTKVFGANGVNNVRFAFNRTAVNRDNDPFFDPHDLGINVNSYVPHQMIVVVTGGFNIAAATATRGIAQNNSFQVNDDLALVHGNHQLGVGVNVARFTVDQKTWARGGGQWNFTGQASGLGLADFLLGRVATLDQSGLSGVSFYQWYSGAYAQDTWRASNRVTVNAGVRWEPFFSQNLTRGANSIFIRDNFTKNVKSTVFHSAPAGLIYPGDAGFPSGSSGLNKKWWNFSRARASHGMCTATAAWPCALVFADVRLPDRRVLLQPGWRAAVRQPHAGHRSHGAVRQPVSRCRRRPAPDHHGAPIRRSRRRYVLVDGSGYQCAAHPIVERRLRAPDRLELGRIVAYLGML